MQGDLLKAEGRKRADRHFTQSGVPWDGKSFKIVSNYYGVNSTETADKKATVAMEFEDEGSIDVQLRYVPPPRRPLYEGKVPVYKISMMYQLILTPMEIKTQLPDGKYEKKPGNVLEWEIEGSLLGAFHMPWTTVNTAIRYVLEKKQKSTDPTVKANADKTLAILMHLQ